MAPLIPVCSKCGKPHVTKDGRQACAGHKSSSSPKFGEPLIPCQNLPANGTTVCRNHGGAAPQTIDKAKREEKERTATKRIEDELQRLMIPLERLDPIHEMLHRVQYEAAFCRVLQKLIGEYKAEVLVDPLEMEPHVLVKMLKEWTDMTARHCKLLADAGIDQRRISLAEGMGNILANAIQAILDDLGLSPDQLKMVPEVVTRHLRTVAELEAPGGGTL